MTDQNTRPTPSSDVAVEALRAIAEGNLGDQPWQANYDRIRQVAVSALSRLSNPAQVEVTDEMVRAGAMRMITALPDVAIGAIRTAGYSLDEIVRSILTAALTCTDAKPVSHEHIEVTDAGLQGFAEWFRKNYPGPDTLIHKPDWHSPKIYRAALHHARSTDAKPVVPAEPVAVQQLGPDGRLTPYFVNGAEVPRLWTAKGFGHRFLYAAPPSAVEKSLEGKQ